ncbi:patatin-like phospholipase family protein [Ramlibacter sp. AW1]|uniref:Patatin-like phospholipase family protein n=1 Tax=Ramlibacter aurantiacus TaxID=2801330 RepID=A0A936ZTA2_9BURK|nr:patatin-like phospholipase family protein [Ramlibacter aurantiacus]MBL0423235.1 patatin-like phospholipase family protein [Ramlibacter aurantiacus]
MSIVDSAQQPPLVLNYLTPPVRQRNAEAGDRPCVGLVLGAGAYRGAAHVGVIRALEREGIPIDLIVGSSAGALAGVMYSAGMSVDLMEAALRKLKLQDLFTPSMGSDGFTDLGPARRGIESFIGADRDIRSFPRRFACIAADALTGEAVVICRGHAASAVEASMAVPGLVRPVPFDGRHLVDGGVVQPMPVTVARGLGADLVIAVDVHVPRYGSRIARSPAESLSHCFDMAVQRLCDAEARSANVVIRPDLGQFKQDLGNVSGFLNAGELAGRAAIPQIRNLLGHAQALTH